MYYIITIIIIIIAWTRTVRVFLGFFDWFHLRWFNMLYVWLSPFCYG